MLILKHKQKEIKMKESIISKEEKRIDGLFQKAVQKISINDYSPNKIREFLKKKGASKSEIEIVVKKLNKYDLLNEDELISSVISFCDSKHYGYNRIIKMLNDRQVSKDKIAKVNKDETRETKEASELVKRLVKRYKKKNTVNLKRNIYSALIRYGFDENIASLESSKVYNSPSNELNMLKLEYSKLVSSYSRKLKGKELNNKIVKSLLSKGYHKIDIQHVLKEVDKYEMD